MNTPIHFYTDKPIFGLDIGRSSLKVMQLDHADGQSTIVGYGTADFDLKALDDGVIVMPEVIAQAMREMFENRLMGEITTNRVAMTLPGYRVFTRSMSLPKLGADELHDAVQLEVEQYVPMQLEDLYLDYSVTSETADSSNIFVVAVPKRIVDSHLSLATKLGMQPILIEPTMTAGARFFARDKHSDLASAIIDFGSLTATITIYDKTILATSTVSAGGLVFTEAIRNALNVTNEDAGNIKTKFGLGVSKYQQQIMQALEPSLGMVVTEVKRMLRYYEEHYGGRGAIGQLVTLGGGANMPGLSDYLTNALKIPARTHEHPWAVFKYGDDMELPLEPDRLMYATVAGLSLLNPKEVFAE